MTSDLRDRVDNVSELEERFISIEKAILRLTDVIKDKNDVAFPSNHRYDLSMNINKRVAGSVKGDGAAVDQLLEILALRSAHPDHDNSTYQHSHGAGIIRMLYEETCDLILEIQGTPVMKDASLMNNKGSCPKSFQKPLADLCQIAASEQTINMGYDNSPVLPPPRQLLAMAGVSFFQSRDFATDLFCQPTFWANVERVYNAPFSANDDAWAICFNLIVLLGLGSEKPDSETGVEFLKPFILNVIRAVSCPTLFLNPKLINLQALALLVRLFCLVVGRWLTDASRVW